MQAVWDEKSPVYWKRPQGRMHWLPNGRGYHQSTHPVAKIKGADILSTRMTIAATSKTTPIADRQRNCFIMPITIRSMPPSPTESCRSRPLLSLPRGKVSAWDSSRRRAIGFQRKTATAMGKQGASPQQENAKAGILAEKGCIPRRNSCKRRRNLP